jgi:CheY-like chemotaxis protein
MTGKKCVLVVDDEPTLLEFLDIYLSEAGYQVERASNGLEAVKMAETRNYYAIITDVMMPVMDGITLYKELSNISPELADKVIFISGYLGKEKASFIKKTGQQFLPKPFQIADIATALADMQKQRTLAM